MAGNFDTIGRGRHGAPGVALARRRRVALWGSNESLLAKALEALLVWQERRRQRAALMRLDDAGLHDIGLSRGQAEAEYRKPCWRP